jgi:hypothetical protein
MPLDLSPVGINKDTFRSFKKTKTPEKSPKRLLSHEKFKIFDKT